MRFKNPGILYFRFYLKRASNKVKYCELIWSYAWSLKEHNQTVDNWYTKICIPQASKSSSFFLVNRDGAEKSGLLCVVSVVLERMKVEQDVAINHVIEELRNCREQIIPNLVWHIFHIIDDWTLDSRTKVKDIFSLYKNSKRWSISYRYMYHHNKRTVVYCEV